MRASALLMLVVAATLGCSTKQVVVGADRDLLEVSPNVHVDVRGGDHEDLAKDLARFLKGNLILEGFDVGDQLPDALRLDVEITEFDPGDTALRLTVGFGAGRASLLYTARYLGPDGALLAELQGKERFTGSEPHFNMEYGTLTTLQGAEKAQSVLVQEAAKHIIELGRGRLASKQKKSGGGARRP